MLCGPCSGVAWPYLACSHVVSLHPGGQAGKASLQLSPADLAPTLWPSCHQPLPITPFPNLTPHPTECAHCFDHQVSSTQDIRGAASGAPSPRQAQGHLGAAMDTPISGWGGFLLCHLERDLGAGVQEALPTSLHPPGSYLSLAFPTPAVSICLLAPPGFSLSLSTLCLFVCISTSLGLSLLVCEMGLMIPASHGCCSIRLYRRGCVHAHHLIDAQ